jgi:hypothetical protein
MGASLTGFAPAWLGVNRSAVNLKAVTRACSCLAAFSTAICSALGIEGGEYAYKLLDVVVLA